jgi:prepilin-type N-terminal cleavage/methylation domain-containing protein
MRFAAGNFVNDSVIIIIRLPCGSRRIIKKEKHNMKTAHVSRGAGFTLVEIMIVVAIIGLLAAIAIPNFVRARARSQATTCINNMRQIDSAIQQFGMEKGLAAGTDITKETDLSPYIKLNANNSIPGCPAGGNYTPQPLGNTPSVECSLGSNVDPPHMLE